MYFSINSKTTQAGFTLLEMLLSIASLAVISGISVPIYQSFQNRNELDVAVVTVAQNLRRAQTLAQAMSGDTSWGVSIHSGIITLFQGTSYAIRDSDYDELFEIPTSITPSGISEVVFTKFTGVPQTTGSVIFTSLNNEEKTITINSKGMVAY